MVSVKTAERKTKYRVTAAVSAAVLLLMLVLSLYFVALEANGHECSGKDCPICMALEHSINNLRSCSNVLIAAAAAISFIFIRIKNERNIVSDILRVTPVMEKVRMND